MERFLLGQFIGGLVFEYLTGTKGSESLGEQCGYFGAFHALDIRTFPRVGKPVRWLGHKPCYKQRVDTIEECLLCRRPIDAALDPNDDTYLVHCECSGRYRVSMEDYRGRVQLPREDAALAARFAHALYMQGESEPTFDFGFGGSIPGAINAADLHAWNAHRRPSEGDEGKRVWVWEHPGSDLSQIRTGILASWDDSDLKMKDGKMCPWPTLYDWGFGDPPETVDH